MDGNVSEAVASKLSEKVNEFFSLDNRIKVLENDAKLLSKEQEALSQVIIEQMQNENLQQVKDSQGRMVYLNAPSVYASFNKENKDKAVSLLKNDWGLKDLFTETIPPTTLNRVIKERLEANLEVPQDCFSVFLKQKLGHRSS